MVILTKPPEEEIDNFYAANEYEVVKALTDCGCKLYYRDCNVFYFEKSVLVQRLVKNLTGEDIDNGIDNLSVNDFDEYSLANKRTYFLYKK